METWKHFEANELTHSAAHHLSAIHQVGVAYGGWARVSDIARQLNITRGSVSINLRTLKKRGLVETDEHRMVRLTPEGVTAVRLVMAKRLVLKAFLEDVLGLPEAQAEIDSCKIEHLISHATGERLAHFVRFLNSGQSSTRALRGAFRRFRSKCPDSRTCDLCHGQCPMDELKRAI